MYGFSSGRELELNNNRSFRFTVGLEIQFVLEWQPGLFIFCSGFQDNCSTNFSMCSLIPGSPGSVCRKEKGDGSSSQLR